MYAWQLTKSRAYCDVSDQIWVVTDSFSKSCSFISSRCTSSSSLQSEWTYDNNMEGGTDHMYKNENLFLHIGVILLCWRSRQLWSLHKKLVFQLISTFWNSCKFTSCVQWENVWTIDHQSIIHLSLLKNVSQYFWLKCGGNIVKCGYSAFHNPLICKYEQGIVVNSFSNTIQNMRALNTFAYQ